MAVELKHNPRLYKGTTVDLAASTQVFEDNAIILDVDLNQVKFGNGVDVHSVLPDITVAP